MIHYLPYTRKSIKWRHIVCSRKVLRINCRIVKSSNLQCITLEKTNDKVIVLKWDTQYIKIDVSEDFWIKWKLYSQMRSFSFTMKTLYISFSFLMLLQFLVYYVVHLQRFHTQVETLKLIDIHSKKHQIIWTCSPFFYKFLLLINLPQQNFIIALNCLW